MEKDFSLTDGRISLKPYRSGDTELLYQAARESIAEVFLWMDWCHPEYAIAESRAWVEQRPAKWEEGSAYEFAIKDSKSLLYLGGCGLNGIHKSDRMANLGYWIRTSQTKQGIGTAATLLLARFGFEQLKLTRIEIVVDVENKASQRVAAKAGAAREGVLRNRLVVHGEARDAVMFSLIPADMEGENAGF
jgi:ribosomal-protein-serine acetyltransferase